MIRPLLLSMALLAAGCAHPGGSASLRCETDSLLSTGGPQESMRRTIQELGLKDSSPEVTAFLCYCDALIHRDVPATMGRKDRPALLADFGAEELKRLRRQNRRATLRLLEGVAMAGIEPCDSYAWEALLRIDEASFDALAATAMPGSPLSKEKAELARRRGSQRAKG